VTNNVFLTKSENKRITKQTIKHKKHLPEPEFKPGPHAPKAVALPEQHRVNLEYRL